MLIEQSDWKSHDVVERPFDAVDRHVSNPFLNAVCASLVKRAIMFNVVIDLLVGETVECNTAFSKETVLKNILL